MAHFTRGPRARGLSYRAAHSGLAPASQTPPMPRTYTTDKRTHAETLFVFRSVEYPELATLTGVSESQLRRWSKKGAWAQKRSARASSGPMLAARLEAHIGQLVEAADQQGRPLNGQEIDSVTKLQAQIDRLNPTARLVAHVIEGLDWLAVYVRERAPHLMQELAPLISDFGEDLVAQKLGMA